MCLNNLEESLQPLAYWCRRFPEGSDFTYMIGEHYLDPSLLLGKKARENISKQLETLKSAKGVPNCDSSQITQPCEL